MGTKVWHVVPLALVLFLETAYAGQPVPVAGAQVAARPAEQVPATQEAKPQIIVGKELAAAREAQKKLQGERVKKTLKIYKSLRPEDAARLIDRLDETTATELLNSLDQKTVANLIPYLNQPRVLKWTRETMAGR
jgi:hypothetical protein